MCEQHREVITSLELKWAEVDIWNSDGMGLVHSKYPTLITGNVTRWRHQMETFSALLAICAGNSPVPGEFPTIRPVTQSFDVYFDLRPDKRLSKQLWGWWFETLSHSLWRHRNVTLLALLTYNSTNGKTATTCWTHMLLFTIMGRGNQSKLCTKKQHFTSANGVMVSMR